MQPTDGCVADTIGKFAHDALRYWSAGSHRTKTRENGRDFERA
ncbi:hypothetical protein [Lysobacter soli]|nr:hypothetical protein [Lysobacter soli]